MKSPWEVSGALERAARRLGDAPAHRGRKPRSDRGRCRLPEVVQRALLRLMSGMERPAMAKVLDQVRLASARAGVKAPSRATAYNFAAQAPTPKRRVGDLPTAVQRALYNLEADSRVPEAQIAFYCFNYGELGALSYAAGLPWLALYQARRMAGWRRRSRGLLDAVAQVRKI